MKKLSHTDESGSARMVDVSEKPQAARAATASGSITMRPDTLAAIRDNTIRKGDVLGIARIAAIMAAKRTSDMIPLCHPISLSDVGVDFTLDDQLPGVRVRSHARTTGQTGVEMEALTAVSIALLTIYDMAKAIDRGMTIGDIMLDEKNGGTSGDWSRATSAADERGGLSACD